jgi:hypothetical protein
MRAAHRARPAGFARSSQRQPSIALSLLSREKLCRFEAEIGADSGYRPYGYLFIARSEAAISQLPVERVAACVRIAGSQVDRRG